jgi:TonB family protein
VSLPRALVLLLALLASGPVPSTFAQDEAKIAGRDVPPPKRTKFVAPEYPAEAQIQGQRGIVILELLIGEDGKVLSVDVVRSVPPFDEPAVSAVRQWEFEVTRVEGKPVRVRHTVPISFALKLPPMAAEPGIPELRAGVAPAFPPGMVTQSATVAADITLDPRGEVTEAAVTKGGSPWAEAVLQAIRTWRFVAPGEDVSLSFRVEANFVPSGKGAPRVDLRLTGLKRKPAEAVLAEAPPPSDTPAAPPTPPSVSPPPAAPEPAPAPESASGSTARPGGDPPAPPPVATRPAVEVVPAAPSAATSEAGASAIRDVSLAAGVPDLTAGRRPVVPPLARMHGVTGTVQVEFSVDAGGVARTSKVSGPEELKEAARQTVDSWTFRRTSAERLILIAVFDYKSETASGAVRPQP